METYVYMTMLYFKWFNFFLWGYELDNIAGKIILVPTEP